MKKSEDVVTDFIMNVYNNKYYIMCILAIFYTLISLYNLGKKSKNKFREGYQNEKLHPSNIKDSLASLKKANNVMKDDLHIEKYRKQYEEYLIELYDHINIVALDECIKPEKDINKKLETLKHYDTRYTPLKQMINESMKTLNDTKEVK
tara:strand:- start:1446 stop:1892 length:447 start_codon:yes stop_codon:yes gene_type:complete